MGQVNRFFRRVSGSQLTYWCEGCRDPHTVRVQPSSERPCWGFNGDYDRPTFTPSVFVRTGHYAPHFDPTRDTCWCSYYREHPEEMDEGFTCRVCHTFITDGQVQFLGDCSHEFAGQTRPMAELPPEYRDGAP